EKTHFLTSIRAGGRTLNRPRGTVGGRWGTVKILATAPTVMYRSTSHPQAPAPRQPSTAGRCRDAARLARPQPLEQRTHPALPIVRPWMLDPPTVPADPHTRAASKHCS